MAYVNTLYQQNFLEYASYVIKDRAIPNLDDGLKPVQRRIIHSLFEMDDGKFHKVANVVGHCMKYHPHGDASIYSALVVLANKELLIDKQGNFGNIFTGDQPSAARYIECRALPLAKDLLYNPEITEFIDSYDGRNREPVTFPAKIPLLLLLGAEGIAVGMSTKIMPHNMQEVIDAVIAALQDKAVALYPDFPTGGYVDVSEYHDGTGKVLMRAKLDTKDPKRIVIRELPYGSTTETLITSIEQAARKNKVKIAGINDFTTEHVEIEIKLPRGVYSDEVLDSLYAFTDCETSVSVNPLVIVDGKPVIMPISGIISYHAKKLIAILKAELEIEQGHLLDKLHARTLEQIFVEERIYKQIEEMKTQETVIQAVIDGFKPFQSKIRRKITTEDVERLLKIPIRRISLYDINKAKKEIQDIKRRLKEIAHHLEHLTEYAIAFLQGISKQYAGLLKRATTVTSFDKVDIREAAGRDLELKYNDETGYLGYDLKQGKTIVQVSPYDRVLIVRKNGIYSVIDVPEKMFVGKGLLACGHADKEMLAEKVFSILYKNEENGATYLKRCTIEQFIIGKDYSIVPDNCTVLALTTKTDGEAHLRYKQKPRIKILEESFPINDYLVKSVRAAGVKLTDKEIRSATFAGKKKKK